MPGNLLAVLDREDLRDRDVHRTAFGTVMAGGGLNFADDFLLVFVQRSELFHVTQVVFHLGDIAHAAQYGEQIRQAGDETDGPGRIGHAVVFLVEDLLDSRDRIGEDAALDRLHYNDRLAVFLADLIVQAGIDARVLPVGIVDLQLDEFHIRMLLQQFLKELGIGMEGEAVMTDQALCLELLYEIPEMVIIVFLDVAALQRVQQIVIEITGAAAIQADLDLLLGCFLAVDVRRAHQLAGDSIGFAGITLDQRFLHRFLAAGVHIGGIEIGAAGFDEAVDHDLDLFNVDGPVFQFR